MTGYIVFAHGSSVESANDAVRSVAASLATKGGLTHVEPAFLECGKPDLLGAARQLIASGVTKAVVVPYFLTLGLHLKRDLPKLVEEVRAEYPTLEVAVTEPLDGHPAMVDALLDRARTA